MAALTKQVLYRYRDDDFRAACEATPLEACSRYETAGELCSGCPAWEGLRARVTARLTAGEIPGVLVARATA